MARALDRTTHVLQRVRRRLEPAQPAPPSGHDGGDYGQLWDPRDETEAMRLILNNADPEVFEATGRENADQLSRLIGASDTVLDLGCGIGRVARYVAPRCNLLWAVDASEKMLTMARRRLVGHANVRFERCEGNKVPGVPDASVDLAYSILVLQHLEREDAFELLRDVRRMVRPGGAVYLTFPNLLSEEYLSAFLAYVEQGEVANRSRARFYTPQEVGRLLPAAGFSVEELDAGVEIRVVCR